MTRPARVLFLAWGHSIHAERRIGLFCRDERFEVAVVSTYDYGFENARNVNLTAAHTATQAGTAYTPDLAAQPAAAGAKAASPGLLRSLYRRSTQLPLVGAPLHEVVTSARDYRILYQAVESFKPDVIFCQTLLYPCYLSLALPQPIPRMVTFWNGDVLAWARHRGAERLFKKRIVKRGVKIATAVTSNSQTALDVCRTQYGAARGKLHLIRYPGIDLGQYPDRDRAEAKRALGYGPGPLVLNERGPWKHQHLDVLIQAAPAILAAHPATKFLFLAPGKGIGPEAFAEYRAQAERLGVNHAMLWKGNVPHDLVPVVHAAADVSVSLSTEDSLPNSMLDAMAAKVPVVIADLPQIREWVTDGENGFIVAFDDAPAVAKGVSRLIAEPALAADFARRSHALVRERASSETQVPLIKDLVLQVAGAK